MSDKWRELYAEECRKTVALETDRDEWRARAESRQEEIERQMAERQREWHGKQNEAASYERRVAELRTRAEQAEMERGETLCMWREYKAAKDADVARAMASADEAHAARERAEADNPAFREDSRRGMLLWHGSHCEMSGGAYPENPSECVDRQCRTWAARLAAPHPGDALLAESERRRQLLEDVAKACRGLAPVTPEVESVVARALERLRALEAALRGVVERAQDREALIRVGEVCIIMGSPRCEWDEGIRDEVRQRGDTGAAREVSLGVASHVLGAAADALKERKP